MTEFEKDILFIEQLVQVAIEENMPTNKLVVMVTEAMGEVLKRHRHNMNAEMRARVDDLTQEDNQLTEE